MTQAFGRFGDAGLASVLATLPFPTMKPLYEGRLPTAPEQAALRAFFQTTAGQPPADAAGTLGLLALGGLVVLPTPAWRRACPPTSPGAASEASPSPGMPTAPSG